MRDYSNFRAILNLSEKGQNVIQIAQLTGFPLEMVQNCIKRYGTVAGLDQAVDELEEKKATAKDRRKAKRRDRSPRPWRYTEGELRAAVAESRSIAQTLDKLGIIAAGGNYATIKQRIDELGIDTSHFRGQGWLKGQRTFFTNKRPMSEILVKDSNYNTNSLRQRLIKEGYFEHRCVSCELDTWLEQPIPLELDHINGDRRDNRLENLRLLCPNCHALTPTYRGRNMDPNKNG